MCDKIVLNINEGSWKGDKVTEQIISILFKETENIQQKLDELLQEESKIKSQLKEILKKKKIEDLSCEEMEYLGIDPYEFCEIVPTKLEDDCFVDDKDYSESDDCAGNNCIFCSKKGECDNSEYMDQY